MCDCVRGINLVKIFEMVLDIKNQINVLSHTFFISSLVITYHFPFIHICINISFATTLISSLNLSIFFLAAGKAKEIVHKTREETIYSSLVYSFYLILYPFPSLPPIYFILRRPYIALIF